MEEDIKLGEQIILTGFKGLDGGTMHILRKMIGSEVKKLSERCHQFEELKLVLNPIHKTQGSEIYEIHGNLIDNGKPFAAKVDDRNVFVAVSKVLERIEKEIKSEGGRQGDY